jgi:hypothetical protein
MFAFSSLPSLLRILLLGLLMTGVLVKPVLAFAGELHETEHSESTGHDGHVQDDASEPADPSDETNPWHALVHFSHCCGQAPVLLFLMYLGAITPAAADPLSLPSFEVLPSLQPVDLRPPISV